MAQSTVQPDVPTHCAPFYVFNELGHISDITEDEYRKSIGLCPKKEIRRYPDPTLIDVWKLRDGDLSKVGIAGNDVVRQDLRSSTSIRNRFEIHSPSFLKNLFNGVKLGVGSKHIYTKGDFMRKHRDARLPDLDGLPHIMTLVVFDRDGYNRSSPFTGGELMINDVDVLDIYAKRESRTNYYNRPDGNIMVLFPITSIHEVKPVLSGERHTFVFPVYGNFDQFGRIMRSMGRNTSYTTVYDEILDDLPDMVDSADYQRGQFLGKLEVLDNSSICKTFVKYRKAFDDCVPSEHAHGIDMYAVDSDSDSGSDLEFVTSVSYTLNGEHKKIETNRPVLIPDGATNIKVNYDSESESAAEPTDEHAADPANIRLPRRLAYIRDKVLELKEEFETNLRENIEMSESQECKLAVDALLKEAFVYIAKNMYFSDSSRIELRGVDAHILKLAAEANRKTHVTFTDLSPFVKTNSAALVYYFNADNTALDVIIGDNLPHSEYISSIHTEHDDQGGYDPSYTRKHCVVFVGHHLDTIKMN